MPSTHKDTILNLKDSVNKTEISIKDISLSKYYIKTNKLVSALYMVTDIMDKEEPIRQKLRNLGVEIISDTHSIPQNAVSKITEVMSFLNIALAMSFISEMNCAILKKEFIILETLLHDHAEAKTTFLSEFFLNPRESSPENSNPESASRLSVHKSIGHVKDTSKGHTRLGVQKASTLMQALSDPKFSQMGMNSFDLVKKKRRDIILNIIKNNGGNAAIKDIVSKINLDLRDSSLGGEKTLQRELVSMTKEGVLNKTGEKRWSRYSLK